MHFTESNTTSPPLASRAPAEKAAPRVTRIPQCAQREVRWADASSAPPAHAVAQTKAAAPRDPRKLRRLAYRGMPLF
jgi:hypothetical protein